MEVDALLQLLRRRLDVAEERHHDVLVNVAVAVLLEGFLNAIAEIELRERSMESAVQYDKIAGTFDPLLATFANFHSEEHLSSQVSSSSQGIVAKAY